MKLVICSWLPINCEPKALIFLCHGYAMKCSISMKDAAIRLAKPGFVVYGMNYEGHGKSAGLQGYVPDFDAIVEDCSDHYSKISEKKENKKKMRLLMGESMEGAVVLLLHRKKPDFWDGAVLIAPMCKGATSTETYVAVGQKNTFAVGKSGELNLLDEKALLACIVRTIPPSSGRIRISSMISNRLGKMLAPLHWHDYKKKYEKFDEFVANHPKLFLIDGDFIQLREGAQEIIGATAGAAKVAAAAPSSYSSRLHLVLSNSFLQVLVEKMGLPDGVNSVSPTSDEDGLRKLPFLLYP